MSRSTFHIVKNVLDRAGVPKPGDVALEVVSELVDAGFSVGVTFDQVAELERRASDAESLVTASKVRSTITGVKSELSELLASVEDWQNAS